MSSGPRVTVTGGGDEVILYRHGNNYPTGKLPVLNKFFDLLKEGLNRAKVIQAWGWLILRGAEEDGAAFDLSPSENGQSGTSKAEAFEPTKTIHGDIEDLYLFQVTKCRIKHRRIRHHVRFDAIISLSPNRGRFNTAGLSPSRLRSLRAKGQTELKCSRAKPPRSHR